MPAGIIRTQFGSGTNQKFQDIYNIQDSKYYNEKKQRSKIKFWCLCGKIHKQSKVKRVKFLDEVSQQSKRLNSANKQRRRLLQRESRSPELVKADLTPTHQHEVFHNANPRQLSQEMLNDDEDEDGDITPKVCQLDSVRELDEDREIREITERNQQSNCWSSFSWSSLYDRGTDSSLSWADDEYEKETTETVRKMFENVEELFYKPSSSQAHSRQRRKSSNQTPQEKECQMWRDNFPNLRVVGRSIKIEKPKKYSGSTANLSITGRQSYVLRRTGSLQRVKTRHTEDVANTEEEGVEEVYAEHGSYSNNPQTIGSPLTSQKFETEPTKYFEEKIFSALFDKLLISVSGDLDPAISCYEEKVMSGERLDPAWEEAVNAMRAQGRRDSLEEDSIFSLGKIIASPRYGQYPDLSDEEEDQVYTEHLSLPYDPLSLPTLRQVPSSAPPVRILQPPSASQTAASGRPKRSNSFKTDNNGLSRNYSERRKSEIKKQNRSLERNSKPNSSSSTRGSIKSRRSRSQSGSPPYGRIGVSLPPIERPKTMGSQVASRGQAEVAVPGQGGRSREREQKQRSGRSEVQFSVSGVSLKQHSQEDRRMGVNSRISMNGPLHWDAGVGRKQGSGSVRKTRSVCHDQKSPSSLGNRANSAPKPRKLRPIKI